MIVIAEEILGALASDRFKALRNYGDRWGIAHVAADGVSIAEIFDDSLDRLLETWIELDKDLETEHADNEADDVG